jgi:zinc transport system substrate-binding protein
MSASPSFRAGLRIPRWLGLNQSALVLAFSFIGAFQFTANAKLTVLTSFLPIYCFAANVAGNAAQVDNLIPPGAEPHDYQLSVRDRQRIATANLVIFNNLGIDEWLNRVLPERSSHFMSGSASAGLSSELILRNGRSPKRDSLTNCNPHIWLDPILAMHSVSNIARAFVAADPANQSEYLQNASNYVARLQTLHEELQSGLAPYQGAGIVTLHDSFPYFARRYGLVVAGVIEETPDVSPSAQDLARLYKVIRKTKPKVIFTEPQFSPRLAYQIGADLKIPVASLNTLETGPLKPDAYEQIMRENLRTLQRTLK